MSLTFFFLTTERPSEVFNRALERPTTFSSVLQIQEYTFLFFLFYSFTSADKYYTFDIQYCSAVCPSNGR